MPVKNLSRAGALLEIGRARDALTAVGEVLAAQPDDTEALLLAARCHLQLDEPRYAVMAATSALAQDPTEPTAWVLSSYAFAAVNDTNRAVWHAEQAIAQWPHLPGGHWALATALLNQSRYGARVRAAAARVLEMQPLDPDAHVLSAQAEMYPRLGRPGPAARRRARAHLAKALDLDPNHLEARHEIAALAALGWGFARGLRGSAQVLQSSPFETAPLGAIAYIFRRLIWLVHLLILAAFYGCLFGEVDGSVVASRVSAGLAALVLMLLFVNIRWQLGSSAVAHLRAFPRRDWSGTAWIGCLLAAVLCLNVAAWVPTLVAMLALAKIFILVGAVLSWIPGRFEA